MKLILFFLLLSITQANAWSCPTARRQKDEPLEDFNKRHQAWADTHKKQAFEGADAVVLGKMTKLTIKPHFGFNIADSTVIDAETRKIETRDAEVFYSHIFIHVELDVIKNFKGKFDKKLTFYSEYEQAAGGPLFGENLLRLAPNGEILILLHESQMNENPYPKGLTGSLEGCRNIMVNLNDLKRWGIAE